MVSFRASQSCNKSPTIDRKWWAWSGPCILSGERWNSTTRTWWTAAKALIGKFMTVNQEREFGDRRWSDTVVVQFCKRCQLEMGQCSNLDCVMVRFILLSRNRSLWVQGGVQSQDWNLKELMEWHHQAWSLRLNLTQRGECYRVRTLRWLTDWELFLDPLEGGAWPLLVRGVICLVDSDNERDLHLLKTLDRFCRSTMNGSACLAFRVGRDPMCFSEDLYTFQSMRKQEATAGLWCPQMFRAARERHWKQPHVRLVIRVKLPIPKWCWVLIQLFPCLGLMLVIVHLERGMPSMRSSSDCTDWVPAICTHRPSFLPMIDG